MIKDKGRSLQRALLYSYQACTVQKVQHHSQVLFIEKDPVDEGMTLPFPHVRALINPDKVKQDYDDKIISIDYCHGFEPGDVFEWKKTNTYWIIYTQEITEDAYFRGEIRRCRYKIRFKDEDGKWCETWAAIRGPVETQINSIQKNQERIDVPNLSLNILMPQNEKTLAAFERYKEFLLAGRCWRVEAHDSISMKNILEINAEEYYINLDTDDVDKEMKNGLIIEPVESPENGIKGHGFIKPKIPETYYADVPGGDWSIKECDFPVEIQNKDSESVTLMWTKMTHGQFTLQYELNDIIFERVIVVESLY